MDDLDTTLWILRAVPPPWLWLALLFVPFAVYLAARWRGYRDQVIDPQLGFKVALSFFALVALQVLLAGTTTFMYAIISTSEHKGDIYRLALGLIVPAGIVLGVHIALLVRTNQAQFSAVRRMFVGINLLVTGVLGFGALVFACEALFNGAKWHEVGRIGGSGVIVYGSAWAVLGVQMSRLAGAPTAPVTAMLPPPAAMPSGGGGPNKPDGGLPSLGKGAFPPIDRQS
jgi:hypothetical protein